MLLSGRSRLFGVEETVTLSFAISSPELKLISVVGVPPKQAILDAVAANSMEAEILAAPESNAHVAQALPGWSSSLAKLHTLEDESHLPTNSARAVRLLTHGEIATMTHLPRDLKEDLETAFGNSPVAATFVEGVPVSFCYAGAQTETLWDISIDTLVGYRNQGYAAVCVAYMIELMRRQGKQPVWGALETNEASLRLAAKLGFAAMDTIVVFQHQSTV